MFKKMIAELLNIPQLNTQDIRPSCMMYLTQEKELKQETFTVVMAEKWSIYLSVDTYNSQHKEHYQPFSAMVL